MNRLIHIPWLMILVAFCTWNPGLSAQKIVINELSVCNISNELDPNWDFTGWVEFYNTTGDSLNLKNYRFSDESGNPLKYRLLYDRWLPPHGYASIWLNDEAYDGNGLFLDLDASGGLISIAEKTGLVYDIVSYPIQYTNVSWGRSSDGGGTFGYFLASTHNASNNGSSTGTQVVAAPQLSQPGGFYTSPVSVTLQCLTPGASIHYSLDGSNPTKAHPRYNGTPILIEKTAPLRAQAYADGYLTGPISAATYLINERKPDLPVVFLTIDSTYLYDSIIGIHTVGTNGIVAGGSTTAPANYNQDWTRPAHFELVEPTNKQVLNQVVGLAISGNATRHYAQKSLKIKASKRFGNNRLNYDFFPEKPNLRFKSILLRNGGQDWKEGGIRDGFLQSAAGVLNLEHQAINPAVVYINGTYWGYMYLQERHNEDFIYSNRGLDEPTIDVVENNWKEEAASGNLLNYITMKEFISTADLTRDSNYNKAIQLFDIDSYLNYMAMELFISNEDWPRNNQKLYASKTDGRWRWILQDLDNGYKHTNKNLLGEFINSTYTNFSLRMILYLLKNDTFKQRYIDTQCLIAGSVFRPDRANSLLDSILKKIDSEYVIHANRWNIAHKYRNELHYSIRYHKDSTLYFREAAYRNLRTNFNLDSAYILNIATSHPVTLQFNSLEIPVLPYDGRYFKGMPFTLEAPTYAAEKTFQHWSVRIKGQPEQRVESPTLTLSLTDSTSVKAVYGSMLTARRSGLYINELSASNPIFADNFFKTEDWVELYNNSDATIDLDRFFLSNTASNLSLFALSGGSVKTIPPRGYLIVWCSNEPTRGSHHATFKLAKEGGQVFLSELQTSGITLVDSLSYTLINTYKSVGRYPDGSDKVFVLNEPTIEKQNLKSYYNQPLYTQPSVIVGMEQTQTNTLKEVEVTTDKNRQTLRFFNRTGKSLRTEIYSLEGMRVASFQLVDGESTLDISHLRKAVHIARIEGIPS